MKATPKKRGRKSCAATRRFRGAEVEQVSAALAQLVGTLKKFLCAFAKILAVPADGLDGLTVSSAEGVADFFSATWRQQKCDTRSYAQARHEKSDVPRFSAAFVSLIWFFMSFNKSIYKSVFSAHNESPE